MNARDMLLQRLTQRIMRMRTAFERFDDISAEREKIGPQWNVRDLAGHMAYWAAESVAQLSRLAKGGPAPTYQLDRINEEVFKKNRRMSYVMLLPQLRAAEEQLQAVVRNLNPDSLIGETPLRQNLDEAVLDHYDHHWPGLDEAVRRIG